MKHFGMLISLVLLTLLLVSCKDDETEKDERGITVEIGGKTYSFKLAETVEDLEKDDVVVPVSVCLLGSCSHSYSIGQVGTYSQFTLSLDLPEEDAELLALAGKTISFDPGDAINASISIEAEDTYYYVDETATNILTIFTIQKGEIDGENIEYDLTGEFSVTLKDIKSEETIAVTGFFDVYGIVSTGE